MSIAKRLLALLMCLLMIFGMIACSADDTDATDDSALSSDSGFGSGLGGYITGASKVPANYVSIAEQETARYRIVYETKLDAAIIQKINTHLSTLKTKIGVTMESVTDTQLAAPSGLPEILIGETNRADSKTASSALKSGEYKIQYNSTTKNIVIAAGDDTSLSTAIDKFFNDNIDVNKRYLAVPNNYSDSKSSSSSSFPTAPVMINGVPLKEFTVVYPKGADTLTQYAAQNLVDYANTNLGIKLTMNDDSKAEKQYEILVGKTKRAASNISSVMRDGQYVLMQKGTKIVMQGKGIYVGAAVGTFVSKYLPKNTGKNVDITTLPDSATAQTYKFPTTFRNAVIMIGDGMGFNHIEMAKNGGMKEFYAEQFPNKGKARTRSQTVINGNAENYTDSAAAATALATGYKTLNGRVGVDSNGKNLKNIRELAYEKGAKTAVVTTDVIGGATPGGFLAHNKQRKVNNVTNPDIINQINTLISQKKVNYTMGRTKDDASAPNPDILKGAREALAIISKGGSQFFMMIEGAYIDKDSHNNRYDSCVNMVKQYNDVIAYMSTFVFCHPDTVLIVTADHETGALTKDSSQKYGYKYTSGSSSYRQHTNNDVPVFALGPKTEYFNGYRVENVLIPHFAAQAYGNTNFGDSKYFNERTKI